MTRRDSLPDSFMPGVRTAVAAFALIASLVLGGCSSDDGPAAPPVVPTGSIQVQVHLGAVGVAGVSVVLANAAPLDTVVTTATGTVTFSNLANGDYSVSLLELPVHYHAILPPGGTQTVTLAGGAGNSITFPLLFDPFDQVPNDTPSHAIVRYVFAYELEAASECAKLLSRDFGFRFSAQTDPDLVSHYGLGWGKTHESTSTAHLFAGYTNSLGQSVEGATNIDLALNAVSEVDDPEHADSTEHYRKVLVAVVTGVIEVGDGFGSVVTYNLEARQEFCLVRGDAAVLDSAQEPSADRWYIRRWDDLSSPVFSPQVNAHTTAQPMPSTATTWGKIKARYYE